MGTKEIQQKNLILAVPNGTILELTYYSSDVERCLEMRYQLEIHPEIRQYCTYHPEDEDVKIFLETVGNFVLGQIPICNEMNEYPNIINTKSN